MRKPNFFIIGAPKCGTTSMSAWLADHPQIFMSTPKEPLFFNSDMNWHGVTSLDDYCNLFKNADNTFSAVGEASVFYLYSTEAIKNILKFQPEAKFIVMLRHPIDVAQSLHTQFRYDDMEPVEDFEMAWRYPHANNRPIGMRCSEKKVLQYKDVVSFGQQVARLLQAVPRSKVHFVFMDDLQANSLREYRRILNFIDVSYDGRIEFPIHNASKIYRYKLINRLRTLAANLDPRFIPPAFRKGLLKLNSRNYKRPCLAPQLKLEMIESLKEDILLLSELVGRDLSEWLRP